MTKTKLRKIYLAWRKNLLPEEKHEKSERITNLFFQNFDLSRINFLHCFLPIERTNEIDTKLIFQRIWKEFQQIETLVPRVNYKTGELENLKFTPATKLVENSLGIGEPVDNVLVESEKIDTVLVPLLCFDQKGFRVGYGKGYYDKFLRNCRADCLKIGLSYFEPIAEIFDAQDFDVKIDFCVTPEKIVNCK